MKIVILGSGESGVGAAILAQKQGFDVFVSDKGSIKEKYKLALQEKNIPFEENQHTESIVLSANEVIKSPGIPDKAPIVKELHAKGIPVISEIEFASRYTDAKIIAITGSNGKTTTTSLVYHILQDAGLNVGLGGNIGDSFAKQVAENDFDYYVLELSSFQLDGIINFRPHIAIITNITPDHLDRYDYKFENYIDSKLRIAMNQTEEDYLIYFKEDEAIASKLKTSKIRSKLIPFSLTGEVETGAYANENELIIKLLGESFNMRIDELALQGKHNVANSMAAGLSAHLLKVRKDSLRKSLHNFEAVEHRLEKVLTIHGIHFINDSKATNVNSVYYALESMKTPTIWIVGGTDKGNDYSELFDLVKSKVKAIVCLGVDNQKLLDTFTGMVPFIVETKSMADAVKAAYSFGNTGDTVLLSPACASFDLFENYEDRGRQFKEQVRKL